MTPFPLPLADALGHWGQYIVYLLIGFGFGYVLEISGFGNSKRLAAQFYLSDMTVLKVMFTGIVVAAVLIFGASALGLLDYNLIWVNPTYLWPGIVGGLIMGVGFIIGGFCPGTSIVAASTFKLDGAMFALGAFVGIFAFGETVGLFNDFFHSSNLGRLTLQDLFGVDAGVVVLGVVLMALAAFAFAEFCEKVFGGQDWRQAPKWRFGAAGALTVGALGVLLIGQPTLEDRWEWIREDKEAVLAARAVQIHPGELLETMSNDRVNLVILDVRSQSDYNAFHLQDARLTDAQGLRNVIADVGKRPPNTVYVLVSNDETAATQAWKTLVSASVPNVYILEGGINLWLSLFGGETVARLDGPIPDDQLAYRFTVALGSRHMAAFPSAKEYALEYTKKIQLAGARGGGGGGCG
jgi:rhodanese-related sulfurtransferase